MTITKAQPTAVLDSDDSTVYTAATPPETIADNLDRDIDLSTSSIPGPGSTFIIRSVSCGRVITLVDGRIVLTQPGGRGSIHWACMENKGWLGFQNPVSGKFLGHNPHGNLCCSADRHRGWERFHVRQRREGDYVLLMTHFEDLWPVGIKLGQGAEDLAKINRGGIRWHCLGIYRGRQDCLATLGRQGRAGVLSLRLRRKVQFHPNCDPASLFHARQG